MEIDKKIILKLIQTLEELKKSIQGQNLNVSDEIIIIHLPIFILDTLKNRPFQYI